MQDNLQNLFTRMVEENKLRIYRLCRIYAEDPEDRKDLYHDILFNLWKSLPSFRDKASLNTWVYRVCLNICMQYSVNLRKRNKGKTNLEGIIIADNNPTIHDSLEKNELLIKLYACIAALSASDKSMIFLYLEDLPYKDIADITGLTENHIAVKLNRIRKKISSFMEL